MNTKSSNQLCSLAAIALFGTVASSFAVVAAAGSPELLHIAVPYGDLAVSTQPGAANLYNRIRIAAQGVCWPLDHGNISSKRQADDCVHKAIVDAVMRVDRPALFAVYNAKNGQPQTNVLAADRSR